MRFFNRGLFGLLLLAVTGALISTAVVVFLSAQAEKAQQQQNKRPTRERSFSVDVVTVTPSDIAPTIATYGQIVADRSLQIRATGNGALVEISENFQEGGRVQAGEVLFQIDPASAAASAALSETQLAEAKLEVAEANEAIILIQDELSAAVRQLDLRNQALARQESLQTRGVGTNATLETAEISAASAETAVLSKRQALATAQSRINRASTALARAEINHTEATRILDGLTVRAKFDGVLSGVSAVLGRLVNVNEQLGNLIAPSELSVSFQLSSAEFANLRADVENFNSVEVLVFFKGIDQAISAQIERVNAAVEEGQTGREIFASLSGRNIDTLRPGDFVSVVVTEPTIRNVALIPAGAINAAGEVLVVGPENRLLAQPVQLLRKQGDMILVSSSQLAGKNIVKVRGPQLGAGIRVEPRGALEIPPEPDVIILSEAEKQAFTKSISENTRMPAEMKANMLRAVAKGELPKARYDRLKRARGG
ncbi:MexX family efflux pump subunit [Amylibacter marinus]|uniref:MexX family efflux pump subunit n=1 Tax=Amylibacter marinus TaxID=1475483 RepID=A0ABQ5VXC4_9RHOB|nr:HlyD family efflux transporter periplasmic adaptor subunit [Amylibacter marinus]GLQ35905.1 MexX family efflux pump subunit [Amylibacter marinus]